MITTDLSELHVSAYQYLMQSGVVQQLIASGDLGFDVDQYGFPDMTQPFATGWVFRADIDGAPFRPVEGTGKGAISLMVYDSWASSTMWKSSSFPNLHVAIYGDPTRDTSDFPTMIDGKDRALRIYKKIHGLFHDSANQIHKFADLRVVSTVAGGGFRINPVPEGDGLVRLDQTYNIHL